jgi:CrcB protein
MNAPATPSDDEPRMPGVKHGLPVDGGAGGDDTASGSGRPMHLRGRYLALVAVGGLVGTASREGLSLAVPAVDGVPVIIMVINVVGAFALGALLESLVRRGADEGRRRTIRLLLGTGVLGGFTTYSALATATSVLLASGRTGAAILYALATLLLGAGATLAGIAIASAANRRRIGSPSLGAVE